jgi:hypothetical protein
MKIGKEHAVTILAGVNKGKVVHCRTIWLNAGERQPSLFDMAEMQDAMQAQHPNDIVSVQSRLSSFGGAADSPPDTGEEAAPV